MNSCGENQVLVLVLGVGYFVTSIITWYGYNYMAALVVGLIGGLFVINPRERSERSTAVVVKNR